MVSSAPSDPVLLATVDTEEDQWGPSDGIYTVSNIQRLPRLHRVFTDLGLRPTYFTSHAVARSAEAVDVLLALTAGDAAEVESHLHPWNTPPTPEARTPHNTQLCNLPAELQAAKLRTLTTALVDAFGRRPTAFRAGRFGFAWNTIEPLLAGGYRVDCSMCPFTDLRGMDDGPDFTRVPLAPHPLPPSDGPDTHRATGLLEIPFSVGYTRTPFSVWSPLHGWAERVRVGGVSLSAVLSRTGVVRKVALAPEMERARDMTALALRLIDSGVPHLQLLLHSTSLLPGLSPFTRTERDVDDLLRRIDRFVSGLRRHVTIDASTVTEFATRWEGRERSAMEVAPCFIEP